MSWPGRGRADRPAPARHPAVDQTLVAGQADVRAEPEALHHARAEAFEQCIRLLDEPQDDLGGAVSLQVERDGRAAATKRRVESHGDPSSRAVDPDHVGSEVGEEHRAEGRRAEAGELDDAQVVEGPAEPRSRGAGDGGAECTTIKPVRSPSAAAAARFASRCALTTPTDQRRHRCHCAAGERCSR